MSTHWYLFPTFSSCAEMIYIHLMTKKPCSYCPESVLIYSFYGSLEQETSVALVTRYRCQSYKLFKISSAKTALWFNRRSRKGSPFSKNKTSKQESWNNSIFQNTRDISDISYFKVKFFHAFNWTFTPIPFGSSCLQLQKLAMQVS